MKNNFKLLLSCILFVSCKSDWTYLKNNDRSDLDLILKYQDTYKSDNVLIELLFYNKSQDSILLNNYPFYRYTYDVDFLKGNVEENILIIKGRDYFSSSDLLWLKPLNTLVLKLPLYVRFKFFKRNSYKVVTHYYNKLDSSDIYEKFTFPEISFRIR